MCEYACARARVRMCVIVYARVNMWVCSWAMHFIKSKDKQNLRATDAFRYKNARTHESVNTTMKHEVEGTLRTSKLL